MAVAALEYPLVTYTIFETIWPKEKRERADVPWAELVDRVKNSPTYIDKKHCPLISMAEYGPLMSGGENPILRHAANVTRVFGCELDYDLEKMPVEEAASIFQDAGICALLYTSPSHKPEKPRWRALMPFSEPHSPDKRQEYLGRANRLLGGVASRESFVLSQSFYIGRVTGAEYVVIEIPGRTIDYASELEPLYWVDKHSDGSSTYNKRTDADLRACFSSDSGGRYEAMLSLSSRWAARGMSRDDIEESLHALLALGNTTHNKDGIDLSTRVVPMARSAVAKFGETRATRQPEPAPLDNYEPADPEVQLAIEEQPSKAQEQPAAAPTRQPMDWDDLCEKSPPMRQWRISHWLTAGPTLLAGPGAVGKTMLAQTIATALALGMRFLDDVHEACTVLMWACEDDHDELWRRQSSICKFFGVSMRDLKGKLIIEPRLGRDNTLFSTVYGAPAWTPLRDELKSQIADYGATILFLDNIGQTFGGKENDRHHVTSFVNGMAGLSQMPGFTPIIMGHPAKAADSEFSGSTAWENAVRMRWFMSSTLPDLEGGAPAQADPNVRYLMKRKTNYTVKDYRKLVYKSGLFIPEDEPGAISARYGGAFDRRSEADKCVLFALGEFVGRGVRTTDGRTSPDYLPRKMVDAKLASDYSKQELQESMMRLIMTGKIAEGVIGGLGSNRMPKRGLVLL